MILRTSVEELASTAGFEKMVSEYAQLADTDMPEFWFNKEAYLHIEAEGRLGVFAAYDPDDRIVVGFTAVMKSYLPKFNTWVAITESLFLRNDYRHKGYGIHLIEAVEDFARINGLKQSFINIPETAMLTLGTVLKRRGYVTKLHTLGKVVCG